MKTLIGVGCSHTQGCAILDWDKDEKNFDWETRLKTTELKKLYGDVLCDADWITKNFTWIGKLNNHIKYDKILNFGLGGRGIEANIRSLRAYSFDKKDLSNHLILMQIPDFRRVEVFKRVKKDGFDFWDDDVSQFEIMNHTSNWGMDKKTYEHYFKNFFDIDYYTYKLINEIYYIQDYLELKGANFFVTLFPAKQNFDQIKTYFDFLLKKENEWYNFFKPIRSFYTKEQTPCKISNIIESLNWLICEDYIEVYRKRYGSISGEELNKKRILHSSGLVKNDYHYNEFGNEILGEQYYGGLKKMGIVS